MKESVICTIVISAILVSGIGFGLAYSASIMVQNNSISTTSGYCTINTDSSEVSVSGNDIIFSHSSGDDSYCTIIYNHYSLHPQSGIINMDVTIRDPGASHIPIVISMTSGGSVIGSTTLSVTGDVLSGTISGIGPLSNNESLTFSLTLSPDVSFSSNATIDLNFVAYPLSEGI